MAQKFVFNPITAEFNLTESGTSGGVTDITYANLVTAIGASTLTKGAFYRITDYKTAFYIVNYEYDNCGAQVGAAEPLIVMATSENTIDKEAYSPLYPDDVIYYDWNPNNWLLDICFAYTGTIIPTWKGCIYFRHDTLRDNSMGFDFRNALFRRYEIDLPNWSNVTTYSVGDMVEYTDGYAYKSLVNTNLNHTPGASSAYWVRFLNLNITRFWLPDYTAAITGIPAHAASFVDVKTFVENGAGTYDVAVYGNHIESIIGEARATGSILPNNVFYLPNDASVNTGHNFFFKGASFNTFSGASLLGNIIGYGFTGNIVGTSFVYNNVGPSNSANIFFENFEGNFIGRNNYQCVLGHDDYGNNIGNELSGCIFDTSFSYNVVGNAFSNTVFTRQTYNSLLNANVGIGQIKPSAYLHLKAGTATAGTAPIKIPTGTLLTNAEDGAMEYGTSHLYFTIGSTRYQLDQQASALTSTAQRLFSAGSLNVQDNLTAPLPSLADQTITNVSLELLGNPPIGKDAKFNVRKNGTKLYTSDVTIAKGYNIDNCDTLGGWITYGDGTIGLENTILADYLQYEGIDAICLQTVSGGDAIASPTWTAAYLTGGTNALSTPATWAALGAGTWGFQITIDGNTYDCGPDFTGVTTMDEVATAIDNSIKAVAGMTVSMTTWNTDHFVISSLITNSASSITVASRSGSYTGDLSGDGTIGAYLTGGNNAQSNYLTWQAITDGGFAITIDGNAYDFAGTMNFSAVTSMADVATVIQAIFNSYGLLATITWNTNHFKITSDSIYGLSAITVASAPASGTDISTPTWTDLDATNAVVTPGAQLPYLDCSSVNGVVTNATSATLDLTPYKYIYLSFRTDINPYYSAEFYLFDGTNQSYYKIRSGGKKEWNRQRLVLARHDSVGTSGNPCNLAAVTEYGFTLLNAPGENFLFDSIMVGSPGYSGTPDTVEFREGDVLNIDCTQDGIVYKGSDLSANVTTVPGLPA